MAYQLWLADVLRAAGLTVVEVPGWRTRGDEDYHPRGVVIHETQGSWSSTDAGEIRVMIEGREDLAPPIGQVYLSKTGIWHMVTAGQSNHVRVGWAGPFEGVGNDGLLGIEAQHGAGEPWTALQYRSYVRGVAAICKARSWPPPVGHREHQPGAKTDPGFDMNRFRADVRAVMSGDDDAMRLYQVKGRPEVYAYDGPGRRHVPDEATLARLKAATGAAVVLLASQADLDLLAPLPLKPVPATVTLSAEDRAAIVADLATELLDREAAADRARADVLDGPSA